MLCLSPCRQLCVGGDESWPTAAESAPFAERMGPLLGGPQHEEHEMRAREVCTNPAGLTHDKKYSPQSAVSKALYKKGSVCCRERVDELAGGPRGAHLTDVLTGSGSWWVFLQRGAVPLQPQHMVCGVSPGLEQVVSSLTCPTCVYLPSHMPPQRRAKIRLLPRLLRPVNPFFTLRRPRSERAEAPGLGNHAVCSGRQTPSGGSDAKEITAAWPTGEPRWPEECGGGPPISGDRRVAEKESEPCN